MTQKPVNFAVKFSQSVSRQSIRSVAKTINVGKLLQESLADAKVSAQVQRPHCYATESTSLIQPMLANY